VADPSSTSGPGLIPVVDGPLHELLSRAGANWVVQDRQVDVGAMWAALSAGRLDQHSRILVFSDALADAPGVDEPVQTARAVVAMANAGAHVFVASTDPVPTSRLTDLIHEAAGAQGIDASTLRFYWLPISEGGRAVLDTMRGVLSPEVDFPDVYPAAVDYLLSGGQEWQEADADEVDEPEVVVDDAVVDEPEVVVDEPDIEVDEPEVVVDEPDIEVDEPEAPIAAEPSTPLPPVALRMPASPPIGMSLGAASDRPVLPPIGGAPAAVGATSSEYPASASLELLQRPKLPGQITITVTSSKGGSGKSTASILLAGSIARASADAGRPLKVCLIDLDTRDGQVASLIGKFMPTALNIRVQPVWDEERIRRNLVHADGLNIDTLLAPIRPRTADTVGPDFYKTMVRSLQRMYDVVIMDTSVQYLEPLIGEVALGEADEILFVTTLASTAVQGMARALREITAPLDESGLGIPREKIGIIVNQSVANVGMEREQVLAAGLGVPVVGVVPLATKDVLTATNLNRMYALLDHPALGPAYNDLARACLPGREIAPWVSTTPAEPAAAAVAAPVPDVGSTEGKGGKEAKPGKRKGLFHR
jgi:cellulose biosynthesis protein BcsQ